MRVLLNGGLIRVAMGCASTPTSALEPLVFKVCSSVSTAAKRTPSPFLRRTCYSLAQASELTSRSDTLNACDQRSCSALSEKRLSHSVRLRF